MYQYDEAQFWTAYRQRKGYVITKGETYVQRQYEDMMLFMCDLLPLTYQDIITFGYRQFFRTLKVAQGIAKSKEEQVEKMKNKSKRRR